MDEFNKQRSFVICGWSLDECEALKELTRITGGNESLAKSCLTGGWITNASIGDGKSELKIVRVIGNKIVFGRLLACGVGVTLPYSILSFERLCSDMDEIIKGFNFTLGIPSIYTGMTENMVFKFDEQ